MSLQAFEKPKNRVIEPTKQSVTDFLKEKGVDYSSWGNGTSYPLSQLLKSLQTEQVSLEEAMNGKPLIVYQTVIVKVRRYSPHTLALYEVRQYFHKSGKTLRRGLDGIGETMKNGELPQKTAERALAEELGQDQPLFCDPDNYCLYDEFKYESVGPQRSKKWPGLFDLYEKFNFRVSIDDSLYMKKYTERVSLNGKLYKTITFRWREWKPGFER